MNYNRFVSKISQSEYTLHPVKREWRAIIIILLILKFSTMAISMFSDFYFFSDFLIPIINNTIVVYFSTVTFLILIEFIVAILLTKLAKFGIRKQYEKTVIIAVFCAFIFGINFYTSTNGLANRQARKADKTENITGLKELKINNLVNEYETRINELKTQISLIQNNPLQWVSGKRSALTAAQLKSIESITNKISGLYEAKNNEIALIESNFKIDYTKNDLLVSEISTRYYIFISIILLIKLISNIGLMFFFSMIHKEENTTTLLQSEINSYYSEMERRLIEKKVSEYKNLDSQINNMFLNYSGTKQLPEKTIETTVKRIGFNRSQPVEKTLNVPVETAPNPEISIQPVETINENNGLGTQLKCVVCGQSFVKKTITQKFCTSQCRMTYNYSKKTKSI